MPIIKPKIYGTAKMNKKGQLVIPSEARDELGFKPRTRFLIIGTPTGGALIVMKAREAEDQMKKDVARILGYKFRK